MIREEDGPMAPPLKSCGVLVFRRRSDRCEFLLLRHADRWDLPKGHVDAGEGDVACALREMEEETGIRADWVELDRDFRFELHYRVRTRRGRGPEADKTLVVFLGRLARPDVDVTVTEHIGHAWFAWSPPHRIQAQTIDPLLEAVAAHASDPCHVPKVRSEGSSV